MPWWARRAVSRDEEPDLQRERNETEAQRLDRNYGELLQELRVVQTGVQILFAGLLTLPFSTRWPRTDDFVRGVYAFTLFATALSVVFIVGPAAYHRIVFRHNRKRRLVLAANRLALAGLGMLALAMTGALMLIIDTVFARWAALVAAVASLVVFATVWLIVPIEARRGA